jgi:hypothetical protein
VIALLGGHPSTWLAPSAPARRRSEPYSRSDRSARRATSWSREYSSRTLRKASWAMEGNFQPASRGDRACIGVGVEPCRSYPVNSPGLADKSASATIAGGLLAIPVAVFSPMGRFAGWLRPRSGVGHSERSRIIDHGITCREALFSGQTRVGPQGDPPSLPTAFAPSTDREATAHPVHIGGNQGSGRRFLGLSGAHVTPWFSPALRVGVG